MIDKKEKYSIISSFIIMASIMIFALVFKMVGALIAGMLVFTICQTLSEKLESKTNVGKFARSISVLFLSIFIGAGVWFAILGILHLIKGPEGSGLTGLLITLSDMLETARKSLPDNIAHYIPSTAEDLKENIMNALKANSQEISHMGVQTAHQLARLLIGIVAGAMLSFYIFKEPDKYKPLSSALLIRFSRFRETFDKVVLAQIKISLLNTLLTSIYLLAILPLFGVHLPLVKTMIFITFVAGLIPVIGNLVSNTVIFIVSAAFSFHVGIASLIYLILIHKLEYFLNANIIGHKVDAVAWELILAMLVMEVVFGIPGLISAPIVYAYVKYELKEAGLIGLKKANYKEHDE